MRKSGRRFHTGRGFAALIGVDCFPDDGMSPADWADELERIDREVRARLTPQELAIRRWHIEILIGLQRLLEDAAGEW